MSEAKTPREIAEDWYRVDDIHRAILSEWKSLSPHPKIIPQDTNSREFAEWLTDQYRLAMMKGMQLCPKCQAKRGDG